MTAIADRADLRHATPADVRALARDGGWVRNTAGVAAGYARANLVILPREDAYPD